MGSQEGPHVTSCNFALLAFRHFGSEAILVTLTYDVNPWTPYIISDLNVSSTLVNTKHLVNGLI